MNKGLLYAARSLLIAIAYGVAYSVIRNTSIDSNFLNWIPVAALRVGCLLLIPMRYWLALSIGEAIALGYANYLCLDEFGPIWVAVASIPPMLQAMPIIWLIRRYAPAHNDVEKYTAHLIAGLLTISAIAALRGWLNYRFLDHLPLGEQPLTFSELTSQAFMGNYFAMLTFTPLALWIAQILKRAVHDKAWIRQKVEEVKEGRRWIGPLVLVLINGLMVILDHYGGEDARRWVALGIFATLLPVASSYGWPGTALVGAAASVALTKVLPSYNDFNAIYAQAELLLALFLTALLMFAAKSSRAMRLLQDEAEALRHARRTYLLTERLRFASYCHLDDALDDTRMASTQLVQHARAYASSKALHEHKQHFETLVERCSRILLGWSPRDWWELGDPDGPLVSTLRAEGIDFAMPQMPPNARQMGLSLEMNVAIKQLVSEATLHALECAPSDLLSLAISAIKHEEDYAIDIIVDSVGAPLALTDEAYERLMIGVGGFGLNQDGLRDRARLYGGSAKVSSSPEYRVRVVVRLFERPKQMLM